MITFECQIVNVWGKLVVCGIASARVEVVVLPGGKRGLEMDSK